MRALQYFFGEAVGSLRRGWRPAAFSTLTIAAGLFVLGFFLLVNANLQRLVARWSDTAELAVYLRDEATTEQGEAIDDVLTKSGLAESVQRLSKEDARREFSRTFPDLAGCRRPGAQPVPRVVRGSSQRPRAGCARRDRQSRQRRRRHRWRRRRPI